jgi:hypothetical protein
VQALLLAGLPPAPPGGDEPYYIARARFLREHGSFPRAGAAMLAVERGEVWGTSDYRPPGYPALLALIGPVRERVVWLQFSLLAAAAILIFVLATRSGARPLAAALILGLAPWPFEYATSILADSFNAIFAFAGLLLLTRERGRTVFAGAALLSATLLFRADMIVLPPIVFAAVWVLRRRFLVPMAAGFLIVLGMQYAYRVHVTGSPMPSLYAPFRLTYGNALKWGGTWVGTERERTDFAWTLGRGQVPSPPPSRAWSDETERRAIHGVIDSVRRTGAYTERDDAVFARLREKRIREHFFGAAILPRGWTAVHLWANTETSPQLRHALGFVPGGVRRPLLAAFLLLKCAIVVLAIRALLRHRTPLVVLCAVFVVARTLEIGLLNAGEHRYALAAWLPLLTCAAFGLRPRPRPGPGS